jgi:predicted acylesterase/phospholipase RssA
MVSDSSKDDSDAQSKLSLALCLSGGGLRATFFHLGVVRFLRDAGLLTQVRLICAVSGGSILAAHLAAHWEQYNGDDEACKSADARLFQLGERDIRGRVVRRWILSWILFPLLFLRSFRRTAWLAKEYSRFFNGATLKDLGNKSIPPRPETHLLATSFATGQMYSFSETGITAGAGLQKQHYPAQSLSLGLAVAASSAFPPLFPPVMLDRKTYGFRNMRRREYLTDGGVFDNLGFAKLVALRKAGEVTTNLTVLSDAGARMDPDAETRRWGIVSRTVRTTDILMERVAEATASQIVGDPNSIHLAIYEEEANVGMLERLPGDWQSWLSQMRTDLDRFSEMETTLLIQHGYAVAYTKFSKHAQLRRYLESINRETAHRNSEQPWRDKGSEEILSLLAKSSRRRIGLINLRDWATYALMAAALIAAYFPFWLHESGLEKQRREIIATVTQPTVSPPLRISLKPGGDNSNGQAASVESLQKRDVQFVNETDTAMRLYWVNFDGAEVGYGIVLPDQSQFVTTFTGHLWIAKTEAGQVLVKYVVK